MATRSAGIGIHIRGRVGVLNPIDLSPGDNQVRITVIIEKRGNQTHPPANPAVIHYLALWV